MKSMHIALIILLVFSPPLFARGEAMIDRGGGVEQPELRNQESTVEGQIENSKPGQDYQQGVEKHDEEDVEVEGDFEDR
jgi:hypothetical protein